MNILILYDSYFGNTEKIAQAMTNAIASEVNIKTVKVSDKYVSRLKDYKLLIVGSPTRAFKATTAINKFLGQIPKKGLEGVYVAAFDTRIKESDIDSSIGRKFVDLFGYAAEPVARKLAKKGGMVIFPPEGFFVKGTEGPLKDGEKQRAEEWIKNILAKVKQDKEEK